MKRILGTIIMLCALTSWVAAQFNPANPPDPNVYYSVELIAEPAEGGTVSPVGLTSYAKGEQVTLKASPATNLYYQFVAWVEDGDTVSRDANFTYVIPERNTQLTAHFVAVLDPDNPAEPTIEDVYYPLNLTANPVGGGDFNYDERTEHIEGTEIRVVASPESNYVFRAWVCDGQVVSEDAAYTFVMGKERVDLTAEFDFSPANPANPGGNLWDKTTGSLIVDDFIPGRILTAIDATLDGTEARESVTMLTVIGEMTGADMTALRNLSACILIDLSRTCGLEQVPSYALNGHSKVQHLVLPPSVKSIGERAFGGCVALSQLTCLALLPPKCGGEVFAESASGLSVYARANVVGLYRTAPLWEEFSIFPYVKDVTSLEVSLPAGSEGKYENMYIELQNVHNRQKQRYVVEDKQSYIFNELLKNSVYNVRLLTPKGIVLGRIDDVEVKDDPKAVMFEQLLTLNDVTLMVKTPDNELVNDLVTVVWTDSVGEYVKQGADLEAQLKGAKLHYAVTLGRELGVLYKLPERGVHTVDDGVNRVECVLEPLKRATMSGRVESADGVALPDVAITVVQELDGGFTQTFVGSTDVRGYFEIEVLDQASKVNFALADYVSETLELSELEATHDLGVVELKSIVGAVIDIEFTYQYSARDGVEAEVLRKYGDYANVAYELYNLTQDKPIEQFVVQYPSIVLLESVEANEDILVRATSVVGGFSPVDAVATMDDEAERAVAQLALLEWGGLEAQCENVSADMGVVAMLYDSVGDFVGQCDYDANQSVSFEALVDGDYSLVSMVDNDLFTSLPRMDGFTSSGLVQGEDYACAGVRVKSGQVAFVDVGLVPKFDVRNFYHTDAEVAELTVNKHSVVVGNYLTVRAKLAFKEESTDEVEQVAMTIDLPEGCSLVENSLMIGREVSPYDYDGKSVTVDFGDVYDQEVRFCVIPVEAGEYHVQAFAEFDLDGESKRQPFGSAQFSVEDLSLTVPAVTGRSAFGINGAAPANSVVDIFDGNVPVGRVNALAHGLWFAMCELSDPHNLSTHDISAKVTTHSGLELRSETKQVQYVRDAVEVETVEMSFYNSWVGRNINVLFDVKNGTTTPSSYMFFKTTDITFVINFNNNATDVVKDVVLTVYTDQGEQRKVEAEYDQDMGKWFAVSEFPANNLPVNVSVAYDFERNTELDREPMETYIEQRDVNAADYLRQVALLDSIVGLGLDYEQQDSLFLAYGLLDSIVQADDMSFMAGWSEEEIDAYVEEHYSIDQEKVDSAISYFENYPDLYGETPYFDYTLGDGTHYLNQPCEGLTEEGLLAQGFQKYEMSDGSVVYSLTTEGRMEHVDLMKNEHLVVVAGPEMVRQMTALRRDLSLDAFAQSVSILENLYDPIEQKLRLLENTISFFVKDLLIEGDQLAKSYRSWACKLGANAEKLDNMQIDWNVAKKAGDVSKCDAIASRMTAVRVQSSSYKAFMSRISSMMARGRTLSTAARAVPSMIKGSVLVLSVVNTIHKGVQAVNDFEALHNSVPNPCDYDKADANLCRAQAQGDAQFAVNYLAGQLAVDVAMTSGVIGQVAASVFTLGGSTLTAVATAAAKIAFSFCADWYYGHLIDGRKADLRARILALQCGCTDCDPPPPPPPPLPPSGPEDGPTTPPSNPIHDPAGYVYEAIESNRIEGVTAMCYYKEMVEDMYGDLSERVVKWNAEEYAQVNPLFTDEMGMYKWDVPPGMWQVKYEKEGYLTAYSEWLPVPPPQLEVNVGIVQAMPPLVIDWRGYEDGIEVEFSKYMLAETLTHDKLLLTRNGELVECGLVFIDEAPSPSDDSLRLVSRLMLKPDCEFLLTDTVVLTIKKEVESYAGILMEDDFSQLVKMRERPKATMIDRLEVIHGDTVELVISVTPVAVAEGETLRVSSSSEMMVRVVSNQVTVDEHGQARFSVVGALVGEALLTFEMEALDLHNEVMVSVLQSDQRMVRRTYELAMGWNWVTFNVEDANLVDIPQLLEPVQEQVTAIVGERTSLVNNMDGTWTGDLSTLRPHESYRIETLNDVKFDVEGALVRSTDKSIELEPGWNWIGYTPDMAQDVRTALHDLDKVQGEIVAAQDRFAIYDGTEWLGSLVNMQPQQGYAYFAKDHKRFVYGSDGGALTNPTVLEDRWTNDKHRSRDNMMVLARLMQDGITVDEQRFVLAAFVGTECRGVAIETDGYFFINVQGTDPSDEAVMFRAYDTESRTEYYVGDTLSWTAGLVGELHAPIELVCKGTVGVETASLGLYVYPTHASEVLHLRGDLTQVKGVTIYNLQGVEVKYVSSVHDQQIDVSDLPSGVYCVQIEMGCEHKTVRFVKTE